MHRGILALALIAVLILVWVICREFVGEVSSREGESSVEPIAKCVKAAVEEPTRHEQNYLLRGEILDKETKKHVLLATVHLYASEKRSVTRHAAAGRFRIRRPPSWANMHTSELVSIVIEAPAFPPTIFSIHIPAQGAKSFFVSRPQPLRVRIVNLYDQAIPEARLLIGTSTFSRELRLNSEGAADIDMAGSFTIHAAAPGYEQARIRVDTNESVVSPERIITLRKIVKLTGVVRDARGQLVEGAHIAFSDASSVRSDVSGRFRLEYAISSPDNLLTITAEGFQEYNKMVTIGEGDEEVDFEVTLTPDIVHGQFVNLVSDPPCLPEWTNMQFETFTDEGWQKISLGEADIHIDFTAGTWRARFPTSGRYRLQAMAWLCDDVVCRTDPHELFIRDDGTAHQIVEIPIQYDQAAHGDCTLIVLDHTTKQPVKDVRVHGLGLGTEGAATDSSGRVNVNGIPYLGKGRVSWSLSTREYSILASSGSAKVSRESNSILFELSASQPSAEATVFVTPYEQITINVASEEGSLLQGEIWITYGPAVGQASMTTTETNPIVIKHRGDSLWISLWKAGYYPLSFTWNRHDHHGDCTVALRPAPTIAVSVANEKGESLAGVKLISKRGQHVVSDRRGKAVLFPEELDDWIIVVPSLPGYIGMSMRVSRTDNLITLLPTCLVTGRVVDSSGNPIEQVIIGTRRLASTTQALENGEFSLLISELDDEDGEIARISFRHDGFVTQTKDIRIASRRLDIGRIVLERSKQRL